MYIDNRRSQSNILSLRDFTGHVFLCWSSRLLSALPHTGMHNGVQRGCRRDVYIKYKVRGNSSHPLRRRWGFHPGTVHRANTPSSLTSDAAR